MSETIDSLDIQIKSSATKANDAIDKLVGKLEKLSSSLGSLNTDGLGNLAKGVTELSGAMQGLKGVRKSSISGLASGLKELGGVSIGNTLKAAVNIKILASSINSLGAVSGNAKELGNVANNISKLGSKNIQNAIDNMPEIAKAMRKLMSELSKAPRVSQNLIDMTNALANFSSQCGKIIPSNNRLVSGLNRTSTSMISAKKHTHSLAAEFGKFYASYFLAIRGIKKMWSSVESSMDYVETFNYWNVTLDKIGTEFGDRFADYGYDSADSYVSSFRDRLKTLTQKMTGYQIGDVGDLTLTGGMNLGLDPEQMMNFQAKIGAVTNSVGLCGETSINTAKALSMLSADMSSFTNQDLSTVMTNFQSGLIGQSRALYKYGIDITNATLQTYAYKNGITKAISKMTQSEKMQLRLLAILDQSKVAWGDQANTLDSVANQYRIFGQQLKNLSRTLGNLFLPIVKNALPVVNGLVISMNRLFTTLGFNLWGDNWLKDLQDGISGGYGGDDLDDFADSAEDATDAVNKLKSATLGIDELNIISPTDNTSDTDFDSSIDLSGAIEDALGNYESVWDKALAESENKAKDVADAICNAFKLGDYEGIGSYVSDEISGALSKIEWEDVYSSADGFGTGLASFLNGLFDKDENGNTVFGSLGSTIAGGLNTVIYSVFSFSEEFEWDDFGDALKEGIQKFVNGTDLATAGYAVGNLVKGISTSVYNAVKDKETWKDLGKKIASGINSFAKSMSEVDKDGKNGWQRLAMNLNSFVDGFMEMISSALSGITWEDVIDGMTDFLGDINLSTVNLIIAGLSIKSISQFALASLPSKFMNKSGLKNGLKIAGLALLIEGGISIASSDGKDLGEEARNSILAAIGITMLTENPTIGLGTLLVTGAIGFTDWDFANKDEKGRTMSQQFVNSIKEWFTNEPLCDGGSAISFDGEQIELKVPLSVKINEIKTDFGDFISNILTDLQSTFQLWWDDRGNPFRDVYDFITNGHKDALFNNSGDSSAESNDTTSIFDKIKSFFGIGKEENSSDTQSSGNDIEIDVKANITSARVAKDLVPPTIESTGLINTAKDKVSIFDKSTLLSGFNANVTTFSDLIGPYDRRYGLTNFNANISSATDRIGSSEKRDRLTNFTANISSSTDRIGSSEKRDRLTNFTANISSATDRISSSDKKSKLTSFTANISAFTDGIKSKKELNSYKALISDFADKIKSKNLENFTAYVNSFSDKISSDKKSLSGFIASISSVLAPTNGISGSVNDSKAKIINPDGFASGGYPTSGELFMARENGITEMVGSIGNRAAVANNDQIVEGITSGVASANAEQNELLRQQNELLKQILEKRYSTSVNIDGRELVSAYDTRKARNGYSFT